MRPRILAGLMLAIALAGLTACGAADAPRDVAESGATSSATPTPSASGEPMHDDAGERAEVREAPGEWNTSARTDAVAAADAAMSVWASSDDLSADAWWAALSPTLSVSARAAYEGTDPANVPVRTAETPGRVVATPSVFLARVAYETNSGEWLVTVSRTVGPAGGEAFAVERLQPASAGGGGERA